MKILRQRLDIRCDIKENNCIEISLVDAKMARLLYTIFLVFFIGCGVTSSAHETTIDFDESIKCVSEQECVENRCDQVRHCIPIHGNLVQYILVTCNQTTNERYCNAGRCSKDQPLHCIPPSSDFICPDADGTYPDPSSCTRYHMCNEGIRTTNNCPPNNVYDHQTGSCKLKRLTTDCVQFKCTKTEDGDAIVYPQDDRIYGKCFSGKAYIFGRCKEHERYNLVSKKCERHCRSAGTTQPPEEDNPENCGKYILCAEVALRKYQPVEMFCPYRQAYDKDEKRCTPNAPCLESPKCPSGEICENNSTGNSTNNEPGNGNSEPGNSEPRNIETFAMIVNDVANLFKNNDENRQRRSVLSRGANQNDKDSDTDNILTALITDNLGDRNNVARNNNNDGENWINANNRGNHDVNLATQQRENFIRIIIDWVVRIMMGQPV